MPTKFALTLTDALAADSRRATDAPPSFEVGSQAAFVRALVDEVERHHPEDENVAPLRAQLGDELARLAHLIETEISGAKRGAPMGDRDDGAQDEPIDVLLVDDDDTALRATLAVLRALGYPSRSASDAEEAIREFTRKPAAIVLSDWCMPGMSGLDLCRTLKRQEPRLYVILATGFHDNARLLDGLNSGVDDFLRKPLDVDELEIRLLAASRLIRALRAVDRVRERLGERAE